MIKSQKRKDRLKLGHGERFEQSLWSNDNRPHLIVDTRETAIRLLDVAWSPNDELVAASTKGGVKVWTLNPQSGMRTFRTEDTESAWAFSPDGRFLASGSSNGMLTVWEVISGNRLWSRRAHTRGILTLRFGPTSMTLVTVAYNGAVKIWNVSPAKLLRAIPARGKLLNSSAINEKTQLVALAGEGQLRFINTRTNSQQLRKIPDKVWIESAVFDRTGKTLATGDTDGIVQLLSVNASGPPRVFSNLFNDSKLNRGYTGPDPILSLAFGRQDSLLAGGTGGGRVAVWKAGSGSLVDSVQAHTSLVMGVAFSHDGRLLATCGGMDRIVKIWSVGQKLKELVTLIALGDDDWAAVTPDDRVDASSGGLEYLNWVSDSRAVPARMVEQPPDPTILPSLFSRSVRRRSPQGSSISLPKSSKPTNSADAGVPTPVLTVRTRPAHRVRSITWSPDDALVISGGEDGNIDIWNRATGRELRTIRGHDDAVTSLAFVGPDLLASGSRDGTLRVWNIRTGQLLQTFCVGLAGCAVLIPSVTNGLLICASYDGTIRWLDLAARARIHTERILLEEEGVTKLLNEMVIVSPDARTALRPYHRDQVAVFDLPSHRLEYEFESIDTPGGLTFRKNSKRFIVGGATTRQTITFGGGNAANTIPRPTKIHAVDMRQTKTGKLIESHLGHLGNVVALTINPQNDASFATGSLDGTARIWTENRNDEQLKIETPSDGVLALAYNRDGSLLATGEGNGPFDGRIGVWDTTSGKQMQSFERHIGDIHPVRFSPDGALLAAAGEDGIVWVWRLQVRMPPTQIKGHKNRVFSLAFSPDGAYIATASWDGTSRLLNTRTGELVRTLDSRENVKVWSVAFNPDGRTLATGCDDGSVRVWDLTSDNPIWTMERERAHNGAVLGLSFAPHSGLLATGGMDQKIVLSDVRTRKAIKVLEHDAAVFSLDFNSDGTVLASGDVDQNICLWDLKTYTVRQRLKGHFKPGHIEKGTSVRFDHDSRVMASGGTDGTIRLWDPAKGKQLAAIQGHAGPVASLAFNHDSTLLAAGSNDASASIWDVRDPMAPMKICNLYSFHDDSWAVIDNLGRFDAANGGDIPWLHWVIGLETVALSQLKERYFEPNLLPKLMGADSEPLRNVPSVTEVALYPDVEMLSIESNGEKARVRLTNRGGGIGRVVVSINGKEADADARGELRDPQAPVQDLSIDVRRHPFLKSGENVCEIRAYNADGYLVGRNLQWICVGPKKMRAAPKLWAVVAGISDYQGSALDLRFAAKDAADVATAVRVGATRLFGPDRVQVQLLVAPQCGDGESLRPTRQNLLQAFEEAKAAKSTDILLVYLAGHGVSYGDQEGDYYYLTADALTGNLVDPAVRQQTAISSRELTEWIRQVPALKQVVILDTCASGRFVEKLSECRTIPSSQARALERLKDRTGTYILAGSAADAVSYESSRYGQGLLTYSVLFGMRGAALRDDDCVDVARLFEYAADYVPRLAAGIGGIQRPLIASPKGGSSFPIGLLDQSDRERIPLAIIRPLILAVNLEEEATFYDTLDMTRAVNATLREASEGAQASTVFIDARDHPDAYQLRGRYLMNETHVTVRVKLFLRGELVAEFDLTGDRSGVDAFARELAKRTVSEVVKHFNSKP